MGNGRADNNCSGLPDPGDVLLIRRHIAGLSSAGYRPSAGTTVVIAGVALVWGDVDCSGAPSVAGALAIRRYVAGLDVAPAVGCLSLRGARGGTAPVES